ncbi:MAG: phosphatase PAP2 family protein [Bacteroidetes bacterium HGW-Bacteroidetes-17]|jgi:undecaprenyl-diphosphatase|nr:MAG: phosphatase PAP2 family protein [Bacteroidetes bacterium HGW-Bacteroidetes-17]
MIEAIKNLDTELFLAINGSHNSIFDFLMFWASNKLIWIPLYLFFLYLLIKNYKWKTVGIFLSVIVLIVLSDQGSVHLFKNVFLRLRPCHEPQLEGLVHLVHGKCGGQFGFISSHAANTFGLAVFLIQFLGKKYRYFTVLVLLWALIVSYSRIYLGVHYPGDVIFGAAFGSMLGFLVFFLYKKLSSRTK